MPLPTPSDGGGPAGPDAVDRLPSVWGRLEVAMFGELEHLRERQEAVVRAALGKEESLRRTQSSEENILVLRKQPNCLRRKDAGLTTQLQELDQQISHLRLDESHDQLEMDSRPSSGFYELTDGTSGSLSNSSHSIFSECFCPTADTEGHILPAGSDVKFFLSPEELVSCLDSSILIGRRGDNPSAFAAVCCLLSTPALPPMDATSLMVSDSQCESPSAPLPHNICCYLSPLRTTTIHSSDFMQNFSSGARGRDDGDAETMKLKSMSCSDPVSDPQTSQKNMDSYIYTLLQRRAQPIRTSRPRTSISTDPSKNLLLQTSVRQAFGPSPGFEIRGSEIKPTEEKKADLIQTDLKISSCSTCRTSVPNRDVYRTAKSLARKRYRGCPRSAGSVAALHKNFQEWGSPTLYPSPTETSCCSTNKELFLKSSPLVRTKPYSPKNHSDLIQSGPPEKSERLSQVGEGGWSDKLCRGKKTKRNIIRTALISEKNEKNHHKPSSKKFQVLEGGAFTHKTVSKRGKCVPASTLECQLRVRNTTAALSTVQSSVIKHRHHSNNHYGRCLEVVAKLKSKRCCCCRLRSIAEVPSDGTARWARRRQRKWVVCSSGSNMHPPFKGKREDCAAGSDSEYSAECVSLFHSTIVDTSEEEKSNCSTNCFGDGESSQEEENSTSSGTKESVGGRAGGRGRKWGQAGFTGIRVGWHGVTSAQIKGSMKVKASNNLKKKILRFRTGSLKLMTTV